MDEVSVEIPAEVTDRLVDRLRAADATLVVGAGFASWLGLGGWAQVLGAIAADVPLAESNDLIAAGRLAAAAARLEDTLGAVELAARLRRAWVLPAELPEAARILERVPFPSIWTTAPTELVTRARGAATVLSILGEDGDAYSLTSAAARLRLASEPAVAAALADGYAHRALVFVGFAPGDPDAFVLFERLLTRWPPPASAPHVWVGPERPDADLLSEHGLVHVAADPIAFLGVLGRRCEAAGVTRMRPRPGVDDLEGWAVRATVEPADPEPPAMLEDMLARARAGGWTDRAIEILVTRAEVAAPGPPRAAALVALAGVFETDAHDVPRALTALSAAIHETPDDEAVLASAERLAAEADAWSALVEALAEVVPGVADRSAAVGLWLRLGRWYETRLHDDDLAVTSYREARKLDPARVEVHAALEALYRKGQKWGDLAETLAARAETESDARARAASLVALAEVYESALASPGRAADAYERVIAADPACDDALAALERLYRRGEVWGKLAAVLEKRAAVFEASDAGRASALRKEVARLRAGKLGDVEGAIARLEAAVAREPRDAQSLRTLAGLYERLGRSDNKLATLERLAEVVEDSERSAILRRIAVDVEEREDGTARAVRAYKRLLVATPDAAFAVSGLERIYRRTADWPPLIALYERRIAAAPAVERRALRVELARIHDDLGDAHGAIAAHLAVLNEEPDDEASLQALARLYEETEAWDRALAMLDRHAAVASRPADLWHRAATLCATRLADQSGAAARLRRALDSDGRHLPSLLDLAGLARRRGDWRWAFDLTVDAAKATTDLAARTALLYEAATLAEERLDDRDLALELYTRVLDADPKHEGAGLRAAGAWIAAGKLAAAEPVLAMLVDQADPADRSELARRHAALGAAALGLGDLDKAGRHLRVALDVDPRSLDAGLGLAQVHLGRKEHAEAERVLRDVLARHGATLSDNGRAAVWATIGAAARGRGDVAAAVQALEHALGTATADERACILEELGDVLAAEVGDPGRALERYLEALELRPKSPALLHKIVDRHTDAGDWRPAVAALDRLADIEPEPTVRAKVVLTAALMCRDELDDAAGAALRFERALADAPMLAGAFTGLEEILVETHDWTGLARALEARIERIGAGAPARGVAALWTRLAEVRAGKLDDADGAIVAREAATLLMPEDVAGHEALAELYLSAGPSRADKAAEELQILLYRAPDRLDLYRRLHALYRDTGQRDRSFCLARALVFLGQASPEQQLESEAREPGIGAPRRSVTDELWRQSIAHRREDAVLGAVFALLGGVLVATTAGAHGSLGVMVRGRAREDEAHPAARLLRYAAGILAIEPVPELYLRARTQGIRVTIVVEKGALAPAVRVAESSLSRSSEVELAFALGKALADLRPERTLRFAMPSPAALEVALGAVLVATGVRASTREPEVDKLASHLARAVSRPVLEQAAALLRKHPVVTGQMTVAAAVAAWAEATDHTANRAGLLVSDDLETAARWVAAERATLAALPAKDRLRELLVYASSEAYFVTRRHLGLDVVS